MNAWLAEQARCVFALSPDFGDAETVHRMRVASRRLRVGLQFLGMRRSARLGRLGRALGAVRVIDVNLALLREAPVRCPLLERQLVRERRERLAELRRVFRTTKPVTWRPGKAGARRTLEKLRQVLRKRLEQFDGGPAFHKLRIAVKKYRYGLEIAGATRRIKPVKRLQELMGDCHDVEVLLECLPSGPVKEYFEEEHRRRFARVKKFLDGGRRWARK